MLVCVMLSSFQAVAQNQMPPFPGGRPEDMPFPGGFGGPQKPKVGGKEIDSDEYIDAREENFKKILTPEQYQTWRKLHPDPSGFFVK